MPKFIISKVSVSWGGGRSEQLNDVELVSPSTPKNDNQTKDLLKQKLGCEKVTGIYTPVTKVG